MSLTKRQLLTFKRTLLSFSRELTEEAQDEMLATMYHEMSEVLQEEVTKLAHQVRREPRIKPVVRPKKTRKKNA